MAEDELSNLGSGVFGWRWVLVVAVTDLLEEIEVLARRQLRTLQAFLMNFKRNDPAALGQRQRNSIPD